MRQGNPKFDRMAKLAAAVLFALLLPGSLLSADSAPQVVLDTSKAGPRAVEALTERSILRDYKFAWANLAHAMETNSTVPLNGLLAGTANSTLNEAVQSQQRSGLSSRYSNQNHKVEAVFYAPEGDVMELHDTAEYDLEIFDGSKSIHQEHVVLHYVVLMSPAADRWVIRQLQAVPHF
jgi:hypothetical protein